MTRSPAATSGRANSAPGRFAPVAMKDTFLGKPISQDVPVGMGEIHQSESARLSTERLLALQLTDEAAVREVLSALWNGRQVGLCEHFYHVDFTCQWASKRQLQGIEAYQAAALAQLAAFPDLSFHVDDVLSQQHEDG